MTRIRPIPNTTDPAGLRLELELVLQQPVPGPEQLEGALPLLHTVDNVTADQWRDLQVLPMFQRALTKVSLDVNEGVALGTAIRQWP